MSISRRRNRGGNSVLLKIATLVGIWCGGTRAAYHCLRPYGWRRGQQHCVSHDTHTPVSVRIPVKIMSFGRVPHGLTIYGYQYGAQPSQPPTRAEHAHICVVCSIIMKICSNICTQMFPVHIVRMDVRVFVFSCAGARRQTAAFFAIMCASAPRERSEWKGCVDVCVPASNDEPAAAPHHHRRQGSAWRGARWRLNTENHVVRKRLCCLFAVCVCLCVLMLDYL